MSVPAWFGDLYNSSKLASLELRRDLYTINSTFDTLLCEGRFEEVDAILQAARFKDLHPACRLATIRITSTGCKHLPSWEGARDQIRASLDADGHDGKKMLAGCTNRVPASGTVQPFGMRHPDGK